MMLLILFSTVKVLNFQIPKMFAVFTIKFSKTKKGLSVEKFIQKVQMKRQTVQTQIRLLLKEQSDLGKHCLPRPVCSKTSIFQIITVALLMWIFCDN